ncbi:MAG: 16S rRNA (cytosine(1402)-N(4))-methyltransferase RsmH [Candidatus Omnitrophica bacterium]|nr:16S rRNA (cytosine(1402)-N(4))-methyltransferase RsmH [Candidatus Omnitrophota bacterium]
MEGILRKFSSLFRGDSGEITGTVIKVELNDDYCRSMIGDDGSEKYFLHKPVLLREVIENLNLSPGKTIVDCTIGSGGHAEEILRKILPGGFLIGIDLDRNIFSITEERLKKYSGSFKLVQGNFKDISKIIEDLHIKKVDGFLLDLGISSYQLSDRRRGFSFRSGGPLDMRMDETQRLKAFDLVNYMDEDGLVKILEHNAQERFARRIVHNIVIARKRKNIETTTELVEIILRALPKNYRSYHIHPATRTFQALRIAVNNELDNLIYFLDNFFNLLSLGGRIVIISFHSLEDRIVKNKFIQLAKNGLFKILTKKPIRPESDEISENSRARSAKLRLGERIR